MSAYYNELDAPTAAWLRELITAGLIADGDVDERSIALVRPADLRGFTQCHFFAGIGGWSYALRLAGWDDTAPVWTGSCPCQPFSSAGKGDGEDDPRDLWPAWVRLIRECRPDCIFGEQVEAAARGGWFDRLCADLEGEDYAVGACVLGAHSVGAFHIRQRLWFVAESSRARTWRDTGAALSAQAGVSRPRHSDGHGSGDASLAGGATEFMADHHERGRAQFGIDGLCQDGHAQSPSGVAGELADSPSGGTRTSEQPRRLQGAVAEGAGCFWSPCDWLPCRDGKSRPVRPGSFPLAHGVPARVVRLRGYGNAINPYTAQAFIEAYREVRP